MKKVLSILIFACLMASLTVQAGALEYTIDAPGDPDYGKPTSIEPVITADGGAAVNEDRSKNAALIPPAFGSPSAYTLNTGTYLTPNLAPGGMAATGAVINGGTAAVVTPGTPITSSPPSSGNSASSGTVGYTEVTEDLYYSGGYLATLKISTLGLSVKVYQGTGTATLRKGVGHFEETSIWSGNVALAAHNRGANDYFGEIHTLDIGDKIQFTTKLGTRTYRVTSVEKISEMDRSSLTPTTENCLTLYTCVRDQSAYRWCVRAVEV